jgi:hypothetical protein
VVQALAKCHARRHVRIGKCQVRQIGPDRRIQVKEPLLDQAHNGRGGDRLGGRTDAEERIRIYGQRIVAVGDAEAPKVLMALVEHSHRDPGDAVFGHGGLDPGIQFAEQGVGALRVTAWVGSHRRGLW